MSGVLLATEKSDLAADLVVCALRKFRIPFYRLNLEDLPALSLTRCGLGTSQFLLRETPPINLADFESVWFRRFPLVTRPRGIRTASVASFVNIEWRAYLEGSFASLNCHWVNFPEAVRRAENKIIQLRAAKELRFPIPETLITNDVREAIAFQKENAECIMKPIMAGGVTTRTGELQAFTQPLRATLSLAAAWRAAPCIVQRKMAKVADIRLTVVGRKIFGAEIRTRVRNSDKADWRLEPRRNLSYRRYTPNHQTREFCLRMMRKLNLAYGAFDFVLGPGNRCTFLEINPSGQWGWIEHETKQAISSQIAWELWKASR